MAKTDKQRQKALAKKAAKRKEKTSTLRAASLTPSFKQSGSWPLHECLISKEWDEPMTIATVLISRKSPNGEHVAAAYFLVDLACLGVKDAQSKVYSSVNDYRGNFMRKLEDVQDFEPIDMDLAGKILWTAIDYAEKLGFKPHKDFELASKIIGVIDPTASSVPIPVGDGKGKPFFIQGPRDDFAKVLATLNKSVGEGNYYFMNVVKP
jgi:hypothetical protein